MTRKGRFKPWVRKAESDFKAAEILGRKLRDPGLREIVCFHSHQCAEKYLKAYLTACRIHYPKSHDLEALLGLCESRERGFGTILPWAVRLNGYSVDIRYPGATATAAETKQAMAAMARIRAFVRVRALGLR